MGHKKPRIVVDARMLGQHGIGQYVADLALGMAKAERDYELFYLVSHELAQEHALRSLPHAESSIPFLHLREALFLPSEIQRLEPDLYHSPSFSSLLWAPCPYVQTVHDLNHLHFGNTAQKIYYRALLKPSALKARALLTVSQSVREELSEWLQNKRPIELAPNAIQKRPEGEKKRLTAFELKNDFFLCVSNNKSHKNLALLERAYEKAKKQEPHLPPLVMNISGQTTEGIQKIGAVTQADLDALFSHARAFFFPSLYEGFGRPPLEAALHGTPPYVSAIAPHKEGLAGVKEARFFSPTEESAWVDAFLLAAKNSARVSETSRNWITQEYSLEKLARTMDGIYRAALSR
jgi:glycosyltransferase involved in cell wall biosynthesis